MVLDLYILFQSFQKVFITLNLSFNFKYQLHCIVACVIIRTLNRFLNLKWLINMSSFIFFKLASEKENSEKHSNSKSSWILPIIKYDLIVCFPGSFLIKFLVSIFKTMIDFMLRNFLMYFLTVNIFLTFLRMNFWYYALFLLFLLMSLTYVIHF